jgi:hypothetical protein
MITDSIIRRWASWSWRSGSNKYAMDFHWWTMNIRSCNAQRDGARKKDYEKPAIFRISVRP